VSTILSRINNTLLPAAEAHIHISDMSVQRGYGIFDFFKIIHNRPVFLEDHLDRFFASAEAMRLHCPLSKEALIRGIEELIQKNDLPQSGMRLTLTGGYAADGYSIHQPNLLLVQQPLQLAKELQAGIRLITHQHQRQLPHVKSIDYLMAVWLQPHIRQQEAADVLYHQQGIITECPRSNFFIVNNRNELVTPGLNILQGITRKRLLELAARSMAVKEAPVTVADLREAKEAFVTSTTKHLLPVIQIDDITIADGNAGPVTSALFSELINMVFA
jgi:D-alanine transaminase/branched-chain amino acid aminotransferase